MKIVTLPGIRSRTAKAPPVSSSSRTGRPLPVEEPDELGALALRQPSNGLRLADPALIQEPGGLDAAELRYGHQDVEDLRRRDVLRRIAEHVVDVGGAGFEVFFQLRPA